MIASMAMAVLPVWRSPMISSRWPRPTAVIASMALMPVYSGSFTGWRSTTDGAWTSSVRRSVGADVALAVERPAERVDDAAEEPVADGDRQDLAGPLDLLALLDLRGLAQDHAADLAHVQVEGDAQDAARELQQLVRHGRGKALHRGDAVADLQ